MSTHRNLLIIAAAGLVLLGTVPPAVAQDADLRLELSSLKASYLVAEPVVLRMRLTNASSLRIQSVSPELGVETQLTSLYIAAPGGEFELYDPGFVEEPSRPLRELGPGDSLAHDQQVIFHWPAKDFAFPAAGAYRVKAVFHGFGLRPDVESNVVEIRITAPSGADADALRLFRRQEVALLAMSVDESPQAVQSLETLMTRHGGSVYADYAQFYLARRETREHLSRPPNPRRAIELYEGLMKRAPSFVLSDEAYFGLGAMYLRLNEPQKARESFNKVLDRSSDSELKRRSQDVLESLVATEDQSGA